MTPRIVLRRLLPCLLYALTTGIMLSGSGPARADNASAANNELQSILGGTHANVFAQSNTYGAQPGQAAALQAPTLPPQAVAAPLVSNQPPPLPPRPDVFAQPTAYGAQPGQLTTAPAPMPQPLAMPALPPAMADQPVPPPRPDVFAQPTVYAHQPGRPAAAPAPPQPVSLPPSLLSERQPVLLPPVAAAGTSAAAPAAITAATAKIPGGTVSQFMPSVGAGSPLSPAQLQGALAQATKAAAPLIKPVPATPAKDTLITAQSMKSDPTQDLVIATGKVEIADRGYVLHADKVTYNQKTGIMRAEGHVALLTPTGEVEFAQSQEITGDMKQAFARNAGILFPDNSRMAGRVIERYDERYTTVNKGDYTACNVCKEDPDEPPIWQLRAQQIVHDNELHNLYYHNATIDFDGTPVAWTPYMSTPDPTVKRRQGFLSPEPGYSPNLGAFLRVPYYFDISPSQDLLFDPMYSTTNGLQLAGNYRQRFADGMLSVDTSITRADLINDVGVDQGQQIRGHLFGSFLDNINDIWRVGTNINYVSDKSYLNIYRISGQDELDSRAYIEGFKGRDYAAVNSYYLEDIRAGSQPVQPLVYPSLTLTAYGEPNETLGGRWSFGADSLITSRDNANQGLNQQGPDTRNLSFNGGWQRQLESNTGLVTTLTGLARLDNYSADNVIDPNNTNKVYDNVLISRPFAQGNINLRYPMARSGDGYQQLFEPIVAITGAPAVHNSSNQPIENSVDVAFDETNLFAPNRFTGYDLIEGGSRAVYGLRNTITGDNGAHIEFFGGQSHNFSNYDYFPQQSGLVNQTSDWVGRFDFTPTDWLDFNYGFRLDEKTLAPQRQDARISFGGPLFRPYIRYISAYETATNGTVSTGGATTSNAYINDEEAVIGFDSRFAKYWNLHAEHTQSFQPDPGPRTSLLALNYIDECFIFGLAASHDDTNRADISSGTSVTFHIFLKNVGGVESDSYRPGAYAAQFRQTE